MTVSIGELATLMVVLGNFIGLAVGLVKLTRAISRFEFIGEQQAKEIKELKDATAKMTQVVTDLAVQNTRQDNIEKRQARMEEEMTALRRGEGWIIPHEMIRKLAQMEEN